LSTSSADLAGRVAVVTGVGKPTGIGFAVTKRLEERGAQVFAHASEPQPDRFVADFADPDAPAALFAAARERCGHVDILIANHALSESGRLGETTAAQLDAHFAVNVRASVLLAKELAAQHDGRPGGRVVLMTSGQHLGPMPTELAYVISKGALHQATATLADELAERGITVNTVNPGPTDTGWGLDELAPYPAMPLGRWGEPDDAARLITWLCTDDARWITGQVLNSEGGFRR
jgi:3-oxoacyl-[acyl-carrier protein] reductase